MDIFFRFCIVLFCLTYCGCKNLPSFIEKCKIDYPQLNDCIIQRINVLIPSLKKGIPELKIPSIYPVTIPKVEVDTGSGFKASFSDIQVYLTEDFQVTKLDANIAGNTIDIEIYIPRLQITSHYTFSGRILVLELNSNGLVSSNATKVTAAIHDDITVEKRNGMEYIKVLRNDFKVNCDDIQLRFDGLFKGNEQLTQHTNELINANIQDILKEIRPVVDKTLHDFVYTVVSRVFKDYSLSELFITTEN